MVWVFCSVVCSRCIGLLLGVLLKLLMIRVGVLFVSVF